MASEAVVYTYQNVGLASGLSTSPAVGYTYQNLGLAGLRNWIGRIRGLAAAQKVATGYTYQNVTT